MKRRFILNAVIMTGSALLTHTMAAGFRVYMSNTIGSGGIGLYQLICTIYFFCVTFSTSGITLITTRTVTECFAKGEKGRGRRFTILGLYTALGLSAVSCAVLYIFSAEISSGILGDIRARLPLQIMALGLPFLAASACFRGYFLARRKAYINAGEQLLEQIAEIVIFVIISASLADKGVEYACCSVAIGATGAEAISFLYTYILYRRDVGKLGLKPEKGVGFFGKAVSIGVPVTLSSTVRTGLSAAENVLIPRGLTAYGFSSEQALSKYGVIAGMAMPLLTFPAAFLLSFSSLMIPELTDAATRLRQASIRHMTERVLRFALLFSAPAAAIFFFFADGIGSLLFKEEEVIAYIRLLAPIVPLFYLDSVIDGMLKGLGEQLHYLGYNLLDSAVRVGLIALALPVFGVKGLIAVYFISGILNTGLSLMRLIKVARVDFKLLDWVVKPLVSACLPCLLLSLAQRLFGGVQNGVCTVCLILASIAASVFFMCITGAVNKSELDIRALRQDSGIKIKAKKTKLLND